VVDYISLEPHLRRVWPRTLVSWTRLLSGQLRDPLVGRDVLIGMFVGVTVMSTLIVRFRLSGRAAPSDTLIRALESLSSTPHFANMAFAHQVVNALQFALGGAFLLLLIRLIVRKMWLAIAVTLFVGLPFLPGGVAALATYSFLISLGGRPAFGGTVSAPAVSGR
jgi:hypothetical protein